jgi:hypothetical protein
MFAGQRCERTSEATDDVSTISLDLSRGAQLFIHHLAHHRHSWREAPDGSLSGDSSSASRFACLPKHRLQLMWREPGREYFHQLSQQRDVRARQQLFDFGREFEDVRGPVVPKR